MDDIETGVLMGKGYSEVFIETGILPVKYQLFYTIKIQFKEEKYRFEVFNFYYKSYPDKYNNYSPSETPVEGLITDDAIYTKNGNIKPVRYSYREQVLNTANKLLISLKKEITNGTKLNDDW
jgi:hypothetical protein